MPTLQPNKPRRPQSAPAARRAPEPPMPSEIGAAVLVRQFVPAPAREEPREPGAPEPRPTTVRKLMVSIPTLGAAAAGNDARAAAPEEEAPWDWALAGSRDDLVYSDDDSVVLSPRRSHLEQVDWRPASARDRGFRGDAAYVLDEPGPEDPGDDVPIVVRAVVAAPPRRPASVPAARKPRSPAARRADRVAPPPTRSARAAMAPPGREPARPSTSRRRRPRGPRGAREPRGSAPDAPANRRERVDRGPRHAARLDVEGFGHVAKLVDAERPRARARRRPPAGAAVRVCRARARPGGPRPRAPRAEWLKHPRLAHDDPLQRRALPPEAFAAAARGGAPLEAAGPGRGRGRARGLARRRPTPGRRRWPAPVARRNALLLGPDGALWSDASLYTLESPKTLGAVVRAFARHQPFRAPGGFRNPDPTARAVAEKRRTASEIVREVVSDYQAAERTDGQVYRPRRAVAGGGPAT
ncbi:hypothetical protein JL721_12926 [Aureococcus anophagefferens]|nr:hypothetical protein JL721_12926 [Aureococcus anophagefferens]